MPTAAAISPRLYWQCRRGMLELDILLQQFLDRQYAVATALDRAGFERLLGCSDQVLLEYLLGQTVPMDGDLARVVEKIRSTAAP